MPSMFSSQSSDSFELDIASEKAMYFLQNQRGYRYMEHMAKGSYGVVVTMYDDKRSAPVAVKCATDPGDTELKAWPTFRHPNLVPLLEIILLDCCVVFVMPLYRKDLWFVADSDNFYKDPLSFDMCRIWLKDTLRGLAYLHEKSLAHLDLKLDNVFVKDNGHVCLGDYSLMAAVEEVTVGFIFLEHFQPPEFTPDYEELTSVKSQDVVLRGDTADMWEFGIFTLDLLTNRKVSIEKNSDYEVWKYDVFPFITKIVSNRDYLKHTIKNCFTHKTFSKEDIDQCEDFLNKTLNIIPTSRISARTALSHPFVNVEWPSVLKSDDSHPAVLLEQDKTYGGLRRSVEVESPTGTKRFSIRTALESMMICEDSSPEDIIRRELPMIYPEPVPETNHRKSLMAPGNSTFPITVPTVKKDPELIVRKKKFKKVKHKKIFGIGNQQPIGQKPEGQKPLIPDHLKKKNIEK